LVPHVSTEIYTLPLHDALPISPVERRFEVSAGDAPLVLELSAPHVARGEAQVALSIDAPAEVLLDELPVGRGERVTIPATPGPQDRKSTRLNSSHVKISYAVFC